MGAAREGENNQINGRTPEFATLCKLSAEKLASPDLLFADHQLCSRVCGFLGVVRKLLPLLCLDTTMEQSSNPGFEGLFRATRKGRVDGFASLAVGRS